MGDDQSPWRSVWASWSMGIATLVHPISMLLLLALTITVYYNYQSSDNIVRPITSLFIAIGAGVVTAFWVQKATERKEQTRFQIRANSAVRSLKTLDRGISRLRDRIVMVSDMKRDNDSAPTCASLDEIAEGCKTLSAEVLNAIENWMDITEEADIKSILDDYEKLEDDLLKVRGELAEAQRKADEAGEDQEVVRALSVQKNELREQVQSLKRQLQREQRRLPPTISKNLFSDEFHNHCPECDSPMDAPPSIHPVTCEKCQELVYPIDCTSEKRINSVYRPWRKNHSKKGED